MAGWRVDLGPCRGEEAQDKEGGISRDFLYASDLQDIV